MLEIESGDCFERTFRDYFFEADYVFEYLKSSTYSMKRLGLIPLDYCYSFKSESEISLSTTTNTPFIFK